MALAARGARRRPRHGDLQPPRSSRGGRGGGGRVPPRAQRAGRPPRLRGPHPGAAARSLRAGRAGPLHADPDRRLPHRGGDPVHQHPPLVPARLRGREALPAGLRAGGQDRGRHGALRHRGARRRADHRAGRGAHRPPRLGGRHRAPGLRPRARRPAAGGPLAPGRPRPATTAPRPSSSTVTDRGAQRAHRWLSGFAATLGLGHASGGADRWSRAPGFWSWTTRRASPSSCARPCATRASTTASAATGREALGSRVVVPPGPRPAGRDAARHRRLRGAPPPHRERDARACRSSS